MSSFNDEKNSISNITDLSEKYNQSQELFNEAKEVVDDAKEIIKEISDEEYREQLFGNENADNVNDAQDSYYNSKKFIIESDKDENNDKNNEENLRENNEVLEKKEEVLGDNMLENNVEGNQEEKYNDVEKIDSNEKLEKEDKLDSNSGTKNEKKKFSIHKIIILLVVLALLAILGILLYQKLTAKKVIDYKAVPVVDVTHISKGSIGKDISLVGIIEPNNTYYIPAKVGGEIKKIYVKNGDYVKKGDPICEIDASKEIEAAFIQYDTTKKSYDRMQKLYRSGDISLQSFETIKAQYDAAKLTYDTKVEYATPVAVGDGYIENTNMTINTSISIGSVLCYITSDDGKEINFGVTERVLEGVEMGERVIVEKSGKTYEGYISSIGKLVNSDTGLFDVKAIITSENNFAAGIMAKATFEYERSSNINLLSNDIVYYENGNAYVYVVDKESCIRRKYVEVGIENKDKCEIISGLDKNDKIVATWNNDLAEGVFVNIVNEDFPKDELVKQSLTIKQPKKIVDETIVIDDPTIKYEVAKVDETKIIGEEKKVVNEGVVDLPERIGSYNDIEDSSFGENKVKTSIISESKIASVDETETTVEIAETTNIINTNVVVDVETTSKIVETTQIIETSAVVNENNNIIESSVVEDVKINVETFERPTATINDNNKEIIESNDFDFIQKLKDKYNEFSNNGSETIETTVSMEVKQ